MLHCIDILHLTIPFLCILPGTWKNTYHQSPESQVLTFRILYKYMYTCSCLCTKVCMYSI